MRLLFISELGSLKTCLTYIGDQKGRVFFQGFRRKARFESFETGGGGAVWYFTVCQIEIALPGWVKVLHLAFYGACKKLVHSLNRSLVVAATAERLTTLARSTVSLSKVQLCPPASSKINHPAA